MLLYRASFLLGVNKFITTHVDESLLRTVFINISNRREARVDESLMRTVALGQRSRSNNITTTSTNTMRLRKKGDSDSAFKVDAEEEEPDFNVIDLKRCDMCFMKKNYCLFHFYIFWILILLIYIYPIFFIIFIGFFYCCEYLCIQFFIFIYNLLSY